MKIRLILLGASLLILIDVIETTTRNHLQINGINRSNNKRHLRNGDKRYGILRKILRDSKFVTVSNQNVMEGLDGYAGANLQLVVDGARDNSTGVPYFYLNITDPTYIDLEVDNKLTIFLSQIFVDDSCYALPFGPKDDACQIGGIAGEKVNVEKDTEEFNFALKALIEKYPAYKHVDSDKFFMRKLNIKVVFVKGPQGTATIGSVEEYYKAKPASTF